MFKIKNNRLCYGGVSFALPDGMYLSPDTDSAREIGLAFSAQDNTFFVALGFETYEETAKEHINMFLNDDKQADAPILSDSSLYSSQTYSPIQKIELNGLSGFSYSACGSRFEYYEAHFNPVLKDNTHFYIYIETKKDTSKLETIMNLPVVKELFAGIRVEKDM